MTSARYAIFSALYAPHMGGVEAYTAGIAHELASRGCDVIVVTSRLTDESPECERQEDGVRIVRLPSRVLMGGRLPIPVHNERMTQLLDEVVSFCPDRVVVNTRFYGMSLIGLEFAREHDLPAVLIEHGSAGLSLGNAFANRILAQYEDFMTKRVKAFAPVFAGVSKAANTWLGHLGIEPTGVVPNALDIEGYRAAASERDFRDELGLQEGDLLVAVVGRLIPEKGIPAVLEAARLMAADAANVPAHIVFAIAGEGPLSAQAESPDVKEFGAIALGRLSTPDVVALLRESDAYLLPSRSEGFATTLLEACAVGAFPITTDVGGVAELGIGRIGGIVLPDASAISIVAALQVLIDNRDLCRQQAGLLQKNAEQNNTWSTSAEALENLFA